MEKILDLAVRRGIEAEIYSKRSETLTVSFEANELKSVKTRYHEGYGLRIIKEGRIGFSSSTNLEDSPSLIERAISSASFGELASFQLPQRAKLCPVRIYDEKLKNLKEEEAIDLGERIIAEVHRQDPHIPCDLSLSRRIIETKIMNSRGLEGSFLKTLFSVMVEGKFKGDFVGVHEFYASCRLDLNIPSLARELVDKYGHTRNPCKLTTQSLPVVFTPKAMLAVLLPLTVAVNGKLAQKGASPLIGKVGKKVFDERITIVDDGALDYAMGSAPMDDEGVPTQRTTLFEGGEFRGFIYDLQTSGRMKVKSTGNGMREYDSLPSPELTNLVIKAGGMNYQEMVEDMEEGIVVDQVSGAGQSNLLAGEFSLNLHLGLKVEKGRIAGRVKDVMVAGNLYEVMNNLVDIGRELKGVGEGIITPAFYFKSLKLVGK